MSIRIPMPPVSAARERLVDVALECYIDWREECTMAIAAYDDWSRAPVAQRPLAFVAYRQALEMEDHAATRYACAVEAVERLLGRGSGR